MKSPICILDFLLLEALSCPNDKLRIGTEPKPHRPREEWGLVGGQKGEEEEEDEEVVILCRGLVKSDLNVSKEGGVFLGVLGI